MGFLSLSTSRVVLRRSVYLRIRSLGLLGQPKLYYQYSVHIPMPVTNNCPTWNTGRRWIAVEKISWQFTTWKCSLPRHWTWTASAMDWANRVGIFVLRRRAWYHIRKVCMPWNLIIINMNYCWDFFSIKYILGSKELRHMK